jgi:hypothetical protein
MTAAWMTTRTVKLGLAAHLSVWLALYFARQMFPDHWLWVAEVSVFAVGGSLAYLLALKLNLEIAAEYRNVRWLRLAWWMLAANAGLSLLRPIVNQGISPFVGVLMPGGLSGLLNHLLVVPANTALLVGVLAMWWAYHKVGLGIKIKARDYGLMLGFLGLMLTIAWLREGLTEARSVYPLATTLQLIGLVIISIVTALSVVLHRLAQDMGGSQLEASLRWLITYLWLRNVLVLADVLPLFLSPDGVSFRWLGYFRALFWLVVPWLLALAAAHRAELTAHAARELQQRRAAQAAPGWQPLPETQR